MLKADYCQVGKNQFFSITLTPVVSLCCKENDCLWAFLKVSYSSLSVCHLFSSTNLEYYSYFSKNDVNESYTLPGYQLVKFVKFTLASLTNNTSETKYASPRFEKDKASFYNIESLKFQIGLTSYPIKHYEHCSSWVIYFAIFCNLVLGLYDMNEIEIE